QLREQLKGPFAGSEIWLVQAEVGVNDADQRDVRKVQPLRNHLRADEDVDLPGAKIAEDAPVIVLGLQRVRIHAAHARVREQFRERVLDLFRAETGVSNGRIPALRVRTKARRGR